MTKQPSRTSECTKHDVRNRLVQAGASLDAARLELDTNEPGWLNVAASNAVLAGIAAADAACCHALGKRPNGQNHNEAVHLLETVPHNGPTMAKLLTRLLSAKSLSQYGLEFMTRPQTERLVKAASDLVEQAGLILAQ